MEKEGMTDNYSHIFKQFQPGLSIVAAEPYSGGHIHQTFLVKTTAKYFILQKINNFVFKDTDVLMENIGRVTKHLSHKIPASDTGWDPLEFYPAESGKLYFTDEKGADWRLMNFVDHDPMGHMGCDVHHSAGIAYGAFITMLGDLPGPPLKETIPDFHNLSKRLRDFRIAVDNAIPERKISAADDVLFAEENSEKMSFIPGILAEGKIKFRPTHNDTKLNNILFSAAGSVMSVIDLDTVMPGLVHYDFGDAIRSFGNSCLEDEPNLERVSLRVDVFESFTRGFLHKLTHEMNQVEKDSLVHAPQMFAYMQGIRFLSDYLIGDQYYRTTYPEHNLVRARNQFMLLKSMNRNFEKMKEIVENNLS